MKGQEPRFARAFHWKPRPGFPPNLAAHHLPPDALRGIGYIIGLVMLAMLAGAFVRPRRKL